MQTYKRNENRLRIDYTMETRDDIVDTILENKAKVLEYGDHYLDDNRFWIIVDFTPNKL